MSFIEDVTGKGHRTFDEGSQSVFLRGNLVSRATAAGGKAKLLHLPEEGIAGNSHMLMMDRNNLKVADRIIGWLKENVK